MISCPSRTFTQREGPRTLPPKSLAPEPVRVKRPAARGQAIDPAPPADYSPESKRLAAIHLLWKTTMYHSLVAAAILIVPGSIPAALAGEPKPMPELKALEQMVGTFDELVTQKPAEWTPQGGTQKAVSKKTWALGGKFIRMEGTWQPDKIEFASYLTYDSETKEYRHWYFDSGGSFPRATAHGIWDERTRTITWTSTDE